MFTNETIQDHSNDIKKNQSGSKSNQSNRLEWLLINKIPGLTQSLSTRECVQIESQQVLEIFCAADPSSNNSAVQWLINCYLNEGFLFEDICDGKKSKVFDVLKDFSRFSRKLPVEKRNLYDYDNLAEICKAIHNFIVEEQLAKDNDLDSVGKDLKIQKKQTAYAQSYTLYENDNLKVIVPLTKEAAQWWGQGTRWCTSSIKSENYFDYYNKYAPLFIMLFKDHTNKPRKLQLYLNLDSYKNQFMDEMDNTVEPSLIEENWNTVKDFILFSLSKSYFMAEYIPKKFRTRELLEKIVLKKGYLLSLIPYEQRDQNLCKQAVEQNGCAINYVPNHFLNDEIYEMAVNSNPKSLTYIHHNNKTEKLLHMAVEKDGLTLMYADKKYKTYDLCLKAVTNCGKALEYVPSNFKTYDLCKIACDQDGIALGSVPIKYKTPELCHIACEQNPYALKYVPDLFGFYFFNFKFFKKDLCLKAIEKNPEVIEHVPKRFITYDICKQALSKGADILNKIPNCFKNNELYLLAVKNHGFRIRSIPDKITTIELCRIAIQADSRNYHFVEFIWPDNLYLQRILADTIEREKTTANKVKRNWTVEQIQENFNEFQNANK